MKRSDQQARNDQEVNTRRKSKQIKNNNPDQIKKQSKANHPDTQKHSTKQITSNQKQKNNQKK